MADEKIKVKIGLETHVQLNTKSKIFCGCENPVNLPEGKEPKPNSLTCDTCLGLPGSKPRTNRAVVDMAIKVALAIKCKIARETYFSRKTYFYPDMNKNFQITQYEIPIAARGNVEAAGKKIRITRVHMEEDPAKLVHVGGMGGKYVLVDYNRAGIPLLEIVTDPDFTSPEEARLYLQKLETILEYLGVYDSASSAVMKTDANISLEGGQRIEVKNITGTKDIERALKFEIVRQGSLIKRGMEVKQETRMWNPGLGATQSMRGKETEEEYGYIFEPDLTMIEISTSMVSAAKKSLPELPDQRFSRFVKQYKLPAAVAESVVSELDLAELFEQIAKQVSPKIAGSWISGYLKKTLNYNNLRFKESGLKKEWIISLLKMFEAGKITDRNAEMAIRFMVDEKHPPETVIKKHKLGKASKGELDLDAIVKKVIDKNKQAAVDYKKGEQKALHFLVGQAMRETRGQADANDIKKAVLKRLKK
jgi:aspartyl-tRNA(Asn)/glutamyl-tRNA(Gln) amidotransferase subunit B